MSGGIGTGGCETCPLLYVVQFILSFSNTDPTLAHRLAPLSSGATRSSSSKTTKDLNGVPGSKNAVELSRSKPPGATQKSYPTRLPSLNRSNIY